MMCANVPSPVNAVVEKEAYCQDKQERKTAARRVMKLGLDATGTFQI